jgi:hypothetical protein
VAEPIDDVVLDYPVNSLVSFHYFNKININEMASGGLRLIADSGAFSAASQGVEIDSQEFYEWCLKWNQSFTWMASLDVIGDEKATYKNWQRVPHDLKLVPTVHYGAKPSAIDKYVEAGVDLIGLGGMVPHKSEPMKLLRWAAQMMKYARDKYPQVRFHGWGVTHPQLMMNLPWWSVDSSGFGRSYRYGQMLLIDPSNGFKHNVPLDGKSMATHSTLLRESYGVDWRRVTKSTPANRRDVVRLSVRSMQYLEGFLSNRWKVSAPKDVRLSKNETGPQIRYADTGMPNFVNMYGPRLHYVISGQKQEGEYMMKGST